MAGQTSPSTDRPCDRGLGRLMALAQAGDQIAYTQLLGFCTDIVRALLAEDGQHVEDARIEGCLRKIHAARHTFDPKRSFTRWITAIARHHGASSRV